MDDSFVPRWLCHAALLVALAGPAAAYADAHADTAGGAGSAAGVGVVETFHGALKKALAAADFGARTGILAPAINGAFDIETIARISVGSQWNDLDPGQQQQLVDELTALIIATYAARFEGDNGQQFETLEARQLKPGRTLVRTMLHLQDGRKVSLDYLLRVDDAGRAAIYNVTADGVSDLSLRRAEYTAIIKRDGFDALLVALRENARAFAASAGADAGA